MSSTKEVMADATEARPSIEIDALGIKDRLTIYNDKDIMTNELRRITERLAFAMATEYGADKALIMCVACIDEDMIGVAIEAFSKTRPHRRAACAVFAQGSEIDAIKRHDGLSVRINFTADRKTLAANQSEQS